MNVLATLDRSPALTAAELGWVYGQGSALRKCIGMAFALGGNSGSGKQPASEGGDLRARVHGGKQTGCLQGSGYEAHVAAWERTRECTETWLSMPK